MTGLTRKHTLTSFLLAIVGSLGIIYTLLGFYTLAFPTDFSFPYDLRSRWIEEGFLCRGLNPQDHGHPDPLVPDDWRIKTLGGSYPPWSYATGVLLVPPFDWPQTRLYFAFINCLAVAIICYWSSLTGREFGLKAAVLFTFSLLAMFPYPLCLSYGQYAVFITACLVICLFCYEKGRDYAAGLCLGLASVKPQLAGLFLLAILVRNRPRAIVSALGYLAVASCVTWAMTGTNPVSMLKVTSEEAAAYAFLSQNPLSLALKEVVGFRAATLSLGILGSLLCVVLVRQGRTQDSLLRSFAICAIISMFWSYRRHYDCVLLTFPLMDLLLTAYRNKSKVTMGAFCLLGGSVWLPIRGEQLSSPFVQGGYMVIWVVALAVIVNSRRFSTLGKPAYDNTAVTSTHPQDMVDVHPTGHPSPG